MSFAGGCNCGNMDTDNRWGTNSQWKTDNMGVIQTRSINAGHSLSESFYDLGKNKNNIKNTEQKCLHTEGNFLTVTAFSGFQLVKHLISQPQVHAICCFCLFFLGGGFEFNFTNFKFWGIYRFHKRVGYLTSNRKPQQVIIMEFCFQPGITSGLIWNIQLTMFPHRRPGRELSRPDLNTTSTLLSRHECCSLTCV